AGRCVGRVVQGPGLGQFGFPSSLQSILENLRTGGTNQWIASPAYSHSPVSHGAAGVALCNFCECIEALGIPETVQHGCGAIELRLSGGKTGHSEVNLSQLLSISGFFLSRRHRYPTWNPED